MRSLFPCSVAIQLRHPRLSAVKHIDHQAGDTIDGISSNATPEELRAEIAKRIRQLIDKGYVDLEALPQPEPARAAHPPDTPARFLI